MRKVVISGYGKEIFNNCNETINMTKENRKIMRFARRSAKMFLSALFKAVQMSNLVSDESDEYKRGVFFGDFMNLVMDREHLFELFDICMEEKQEFDSKTFFKGVVSNWSSIEVLKDVPNIPAFLAASSIDIPCPSYLDVETNKSILFIMLNFE